MDEQLFSYEEEAVSVPTHFISYYEKTGKRFLSKYIHGDIGTAHPVRFYRNEPGNSELWEISTGRKNVTGRKKCWRAFNRIARHTKVIELNTGEFVCIQS